MHIPAQFLVILEMGLQRIITQSPESQLIWAKYAEKIAHVHISELNFTLGMAIGQAGKTIQIFDAKRETLHSNQEMPFDLRLKGSLPALLRVWAGTPPSAAQVEVTGDVGFAQHLTRALGQLEVNWAAWFAPHLGALASAKLGDVLKNTLNFSKRILKNAPRDGLNYVRDEARLLAHRSEFEVWQHDVQNLHLRVERLSAQIAYLSTH